MEIVVDAGHGGTDPGASANGIVEKDYNLKISKYMYNRFRELGIPVALTRSTDETLTPEERVRRVLDAFGNKRDVIVLSNHLNAGGGSGAEAIYALRNSDKLARIIMEEIAKQGQTVRKWYQRRLPSDTSKDYYFILRETGVTQPVLIEYGFLDGPAEDVEQIKNNWQNLAEAVVKAITLYGGIPYDKEVPNEYVVQKGDTLWTISRKFNVGVSDLKEANNLTSNTISIGQRLVIPGYVPPTESNVTYVVQKGDSLWSIATAYNVTVDQIKRLNNLTSNSLMPGQVLNIPTPTGEYTPLPEQRTYTVQRGDNLYSIANKYGITVTELKNINNLTSNTLSIGQTLIIPVSPQTTTTYTVQRGDNLYDIAQRYNTTVNEIVSLNNLSSTSLSIGQVLKIPGGEEQSSTTKYIVKSGDNLYDIAHRFSTTVTAIKNLNNLTSTSLSIGQELLIPRGGESTMTTTYTVQRGDNLYSIAERFGVSVNDIVDANNLSSNLLNIGQVLVIPSLNRSFDDNLFRQKIKVPEVPPSEQPPFPTMIRYKVRKDDSLWSIAKRFNTTVPILKEANNLKTDILRVGQELYVPTTKSEAALMERPNFIVYYVHRGDTLWDIARLYSTTVSNIKSLNNLTSDNLSVDQELLIPVTQPLTPSPGTKLYIVKKGDSIWNLSARFNTTPAEIRELNSLETDILREGQIIAVPTNDYYSMSHYTTQYSQSPQAGGDVSQPRVIRHIVKRGESLSDLARRYGTSVSAIETLNGLVTDILRVGQEILIPIGPILDEYEMEPDIINYTVKSGDTLWGIANRFSTTVAEIKELNDLKSNIINVGQELLVPRTTPLEPEIGTMLYVVKAGDTLWGIAHKYGINVNELKNINNIETNTLRIGQVLTIPLL